MKGAVTLWELMDMSYSPGMGRAVTAMADALASAENAAQAAFSKEKDGK